MNYAYLNTKDAPGVSEAVHAELEGTLYMRADGSIGMKDGNNDMPLGAILGQFARGAIQVKIRMHSKQTPMSEAMTRKVQYP